MFIKKAEDTKNTEKDKETFKYVTITSLKELFKGIQLNPKQKKKNQKNEGGNQQSTTETKTEMQISHTENDQFIEKIAESKFTLNGNDYMIKDIYRQIGVKFNENTHSNTDEVGKALLKSFTNDNKYIKIDNNESYNDTNGSNSIKITVVLVTEFNGNDLKCTITFRPEDVSLTEQVFTVDKWSGTTSKAEKK